MKESVTHGSFDVNNGRVFSREDNVTSGRQFQWGALDGPWETPNPLSNDGKQTQAKDLLKWESGWLSKRSLRMIYCAWVRPSRHR